MNKKRAIAISRHEEVRLEKHQSADGFGSTAGFRGRVGQCRLAEDCRYVRFHCTSCNPEVLGNLSVTEPRLAGNLPLMFARRETSGIEDYGPVSRRGVSRRLS